MALKFSAIIYYEKASLFYLRIKKILRGIMLGLVNCGMHEDGFNTTTSKRLYKSILLPRELYGPLDANCGTVFS